MSQVFISDYKGELVWGEKQQSRSIETTLIRLRFPFFFAADVGIGDWMGASEIMYQNACEPWAISSGTASACRIFYG